MEIKVERLNTAYQERKSKQLNALLLVISLLSLASFFSDASEWLTGMGVQSTWVYHPVSVLAALLVIAASSWLVFRKL